MFIGRERELELLRGHLGSLRQEVVMLYGVRRVGKTALILRAVEELPCKVIYYECLLTSLAENIAALTAQVQRVFANKYLHFSSLPEVFSFLGAQKEKVVVILDEYAYLKRLTKSGYVDSLLQSIVDSLAPNVDLVLLGSYVGMMRELLQEENPLFGRFTLIMQVKPLDYYASAAFYSTLTPERKVAFYALYGGLPFVNALLRPEESLKENTKRLLLSEESPIRLYLEYVLLSELRKLAGTNIILSILGNGKKKYSEIEQAMGMKTQGGLDKQLKTLLELEIIRKVYPMNKKGDKRRTFYEISDNLTRFYYAYIYRERDTLLRIGPDAFYEHFIARSLPTYIAHRFEEIVRSYFLRLLRQGKLPGAYDVGTYWYDVPQEQRHGEFDCVVAYEDGYAFYEAKCYAEPFSLAQAQQEEAQVRALCSFLSVKQVGFVALKGFNFTDVTYTLITGEDLYR